MWYTCEQEIYVCIILFRIEHGKSLLGNTRPSWEDKILK
jgi:hypothetical protein